MSKVVTFLFVVHFYYIITSFHILFSYATKLCSESHGIYRNVRKQPSYQQISNEKFMKVTNQHLKIAECATFECYHFTLVDKSKGLLYELKYNIFWHLWGWYDHQASIPSMFYYNHRLSHWNWQQQRRNAKRNIRNTNSDFTTKT